MQRGKDKEKTCTEATSSVLNFLDTLDIDRECIRPIPNSIGPKHQEGGRLESTMATKLSKAVGTSSMYNIERLDGKSQGLHD